MAITNKLYTVSFFCVPHGCKFEPHFLCLYAYSKDTFTNVSHVFATMYGCKLPRLLLWGLCKKKSGHVDYHVLLGQFGPSRRDREAPL